jgi:nucleoside-diphosphate-sugar epimerase
MSKVVLVTGAGGFLGRHLVERLAMQGHTVRALVHQEAGQWVDHMEVVAGDVRDAAAMKMAAKGCDAVFHLAGRVHAVSESQGEEALHYSVNVDGTRNMLEGALAGGASRFVYFSSVKAMGDGGDRCLDESVQPKPETAYGHSKLAAEQLVLDYGKRYGIHATCLRLPMVYGPDGKGNLLRMVAAIDRGFFPPLPDVGNNRSMVHVADVVRAAILAAWHPFASGACYIVTDGRPYSTRKLYELICQGLGKPIPRWSVPILLLKIIARAGDAIGRIRGRRFMFDSSALDKLIGSAWYQSDKIVRELGYRASVRFEEALPGLIAFYRKSRA